jgi:hypothetical protein
MKRQVRAVIACACGAVAFIAVQEWPAEATQVQMALYTSFAFGPLFFGLSSSLKRPRFWYWMFAMLGLHIVILYMIRQEFPFRSVLAIIPIAVVECCGIFVLMSKLLGSADPVSGE